MAQNTVFTGDNAYDLSGPHDPSPVPVDEILAGQLREQRAQALEAREGHGRELDVQTEHHQSAMNRLTRVIAACEAALQQLEPDKPVPSTGTAFDLQIQKEQAMQQQIQPRDHTLGQRP